MTIKMHFSRLLVLGLTVLFQQSVKANDILGQTADYLLDKDPARTSSMISSGTVKAVVNQFVENSTSKGAYEIALNYTFNIVMLGKYEGVEKELVDREYFQEDFMINLRKEGHYEGESFKAIHQGFADAKNMDGKTYPHCDKVLLYDLKQPEMLALARSLFSEILGVNRDSIEDLKAVVHFYAGLPVLGGAKIDVSGTYSGQKIKAGGDFVSKKP